ncbi:MAG: hypothetical protein ACI4MB_06690 [Candidatus Coproplasma sp.]
MDDACCFIGHRTIADTENVTQRIKSVINQLLSQGIRKFMLGSNSKFNELCLAALSGYKHDYPDIIRINVRSQYPYISEQYTNYLLKEYDQTLFPEGLENAGKACHIERNLFMIDHSLICIFYYNETYAPMQKNSARGCQLKSGTKIAFDYAIKKGKKVINLYQNI